MARSRQVGVHIEDDGSFRRFIRRAPLEARRAMLEAITATASGVKNRVQSRAPVGPDAPHIKDDVDVRLGKASARTIWAKVGYLSEKPAGGSDPDATQPAVAFWQEYGRHGKTGNRRPTRFMFSSAEDETDNYRGRVIRALRDAERRLAI
jgi:hypothetical protein